MARFPIDLDEQTIATLDNIARDRKRSRSNLIQVIIEDWLRAPKPERSEKRC